MPFSFDALVGFTASLFTAYDVPAEHAETTARRLVEADFRGRAGHGLIRVVPYLDRIAAGGINVRPDLRVRSETPVAAQVDADNGLGQVAVTRAAEIAAEKALAAGVAVVGTVRSNHAGAAGLYPLMLAERGLVGLYFAVANANGMPPWGGREPLLGTNPVAVAIPAAGGHPYLLDIATTAASHGAIKVARLAGEPLPVGWLVDAEGAPITDPHRADEGLLVPIGGHKGSGLTMAIGLLAGVLNGAAFGRAVVDHRVDTVTPTNTGQLLVAFRVDLFRPLAEVLADLTGHLDELRAADPLRGDAVRLPGDRAARAWQHHRAHGYDPEPTVLAGLVERGRRLGVPPLPGYDDVPAPAGEGGVR
ncbi:Ldh family oxidoreductase [Plantactinospora mayteni]|uniref:Lactate dehydrogenase n=1 Tax=Plantactinospora mayteni TaxID=566021 RepID=A0ABQ4F1K8_9ACTN|nr:Ldh family oxidoreductase [Plantactinospora mayteni]GIH00730.1 lactate dehydrogenase [Plantactinospora mayteni]